MTLLAYWLKAGTQYNLHSPFLYDMYNQLLYARLTKATKQNLMLRKVPRRERQYYELLYKFAARYKPDVVLLRDTSDRWAQHCLHEAKKNIIIRPLQNDETDCRLLVRDMCDVALVRQPKGRLMYNEGRAVTLDMYHTGVVLYTTKLMPQHLLLKGWGW